MMNFRDLTPEDIDVRIQSIKFESDGKTPKGLVLLLYKNARVDMNILDETVGAENWQREHYECKGNLFCRVGILCGTGVPIKNTDNGLDSVEWIWKSDCGTESNTEAQKGEASDSFKRACFNWGIGRELYTSPFLWVNAEDCNFKNGKCYDNFEVTKIVIEDKKITALAIWNTTTKKRVIVWQKPQQD
jgi:hypothetical protein